MSKCVKLQPKGDRHGLITQLLGRRAGLCLIAQAVEVGDEVAHLGVVHGTLCFGLPSPESGFVIREDADHMDIVNIPEYIGLRVNQLAAENKMQALGHVTLPVRQRRP